MRRVQVIRIFFLSDSALLEILQNTRCLKRMLQTTCICFAFTPVWKVSARAIGEVNKIVKQGYSQWWGALWHQQSHDEEQPGSFSANLALFRFQILCRLVFRAFSARVQFPTSEPASGLVFILTVNCEVRDDGVLTEFFFGVVHKRGREWKSTNLTNCTQKASQRPIQSSVGSHRMVEQEFVKKYSKWNSKGQKHRQGNTKMNYNISVSRYIFSSYFIVYIDSITCIS